MLNESSTLSQTGEPKKDSGRNSFTTLKAEGQLFDEVSALRYRAYLADNYITENATRRFFDAYDYQSNCQSYLTYYGENLIGSVRACRYDPEDRMKIPAMEIYDSEIRDAVGYDQPFIESNKFVIEPAFQRRGGLRARLALVKNIVEVAQSQHVPTIITAVRQEHLRLYKTFSFIPISKAKLYPGLKFETVLLACYDIEKVSKLISNKFS